MNALEDKLRESLQHHAQRPTLAEDVAGAAIRGARITQRRRVAVTAGLVAIAVAVVGVAAGRPNAAGPLPPGATSTATPSATSTTPPLEDHTSVARFGIHLDALEPGNTLRTVDGLVYQLGAGPIFGLSRIPAGWLYATGQWTDLKLLRMDGTTITLTGAHTNESQLEAPGVPVLSADGAHLAWVSGTTLHAAALTADGLHDEAATAVPAGSFAATWIGTRVVVGQEYSTGCCGYGHAQYDVWDPTKGNFVPQWTKNMFPIYGPVPVGVPGFANVAGTGNAGCLGRLDGVASAKVADSFCPDGLSYMSLAGILSPDGRHLVELRAGAEESLMVFDLTTVLQTHVTLTGCPASEAVAWEDNSTFIGVAASASGQRGVRCTVDGSGVHPGADLKDPDGFGESYGQYRLVPRVGV